MEKTTAAIVGVVALVAVLAIFGGVAYAMGGQLGTVGGRSPGMQGQLNSGGMMGSRTAGGMMGGSSAMMGNVQGGHACGAFMQQYLNSTDSR